MDTQQFDAFIAVQQQIVLQTQHQQAAVQKLMEDMASVLGNSMSVQQGQVRNQDVKSVQTLAQSMEEFKGDGFLDWKFRVESTGRMKHVDLHNLLVWAEKQEEPIDHDLATMLKPPELQTPKMQESNWNQIVCSFGI